MLSSTSFYSSLGLSSAPSKLDFISFLEFMTFISFFRSDLSCYEMTLLMTSMSTSSLPGQHFVIKGYMAPTCSDISPFIIFLIISSYFLTCCPRSSLICEIVIGTMNLRKHAYLQIILFIIMLYISIMRPLESQNPAMSPKITFEFGSQIKSGKKVQDSAALCPICKLFISSLCSITFILNLPSILTFSTRDSGPYINDESIVLLPHPVFPIDTTISSFYRIFKSSSARFRFSTRSIRLLVSLACTIFSNCISLLLRTLIY